MKNEKLSFKDILTINYREILFMRDAGVRPGKVANYISKKENTTIKYDVLHRFYKELENPLKLEKIKSNAVVLELLRSKDPYVFSFLHATPWSSATPAVRHQPSQTSTCGAPLINALIPSSRAETVHVQELQSVTPERLKESIEIQRLGCEAQKYTLRGVERQILELLTTRKIGPCHEDPTPRASLPLYERYKSRGFSRAISALRVELSEAAFGNSDYELEDTRDQTRMALIESRPTYSADELRMIYSDVLNVLKHTPTVSLPLKEKVRMLIEFREVSLEQNRHYSLEDASSVIGVQIVSRRLMLAIILAYKEVYRSKLL